MYLCGRLLHSLLAVLLQMIFAACSSFSVELVVKLQLELDGVAAFCFPAFADFLTISALARLSSSFAFFTGAFSASISLP